MAAPSSSLRLTLATAFAPAVWGTTYVVTATVLPADHPIWSGVFRALPAGLLALALARRLPTGDWWWKALVLGALNIGAFFPLLFAAAALLPGGVAATFGATQPLVVAGLALLLLGERPTAWRLAWGAAGVAGVALVVLGPEAALSLPGVLAGLASTGSMAVGTVLSRRWGTPAGPVAYAGWLLAAGGLVSLPVAVAVEGAPPAVDAAALAGYAWLAVVGGLVAYVLWFRGVGRLPLGALSFLPLVSPLVAAVAGGLLLGEHLTRVQVAGFLIALAAVAAAQRPGPAPAAARPAARVPAAATPLAQVAPTVPAAVPVSR